MKLLSSRVSVTKAKDPSNILLLWAEICRWHQEKHRAKPHIPHGASENLPHHCTRLDARSLTAQSPAIHLTFTNDDGSNYSTLPQLLCRSPKFARKKFSIQKPEHMQRLVAWSHWPWPEQLFWHTTKHITDSSEYTQSQVETATYRNASNYKLLVNLAKCQIN